MVKRKYWQAVVMVMVVVVGWASRFKVVEMEGGVRGEETDVELSLPSFR